MRNRPLLLDPLPPSLEPNINLLVVETPHSRHSNTICGRGPIPPYQVLICLITYYDMMVIRGTLVRTFTGGFAGPQVDCVD